MHEVTHRVPTPTARPGVGWRSHRGLSKDTCCHQGQGSGRRGEQALPWHLLHANSAPASHPRCPLRSTTALGGGTVTTLILPPGPDGTGQRAAVALRNHAVPLSASGQTQIMGALCLCYIDRYRREENWKSHPCHLSLSQASRVAHHRAPP